MIPAIVFHGIVPCVATLLLYIFMAALGLLNKRQNKLLKSSLLVISIILFSNLLSAQNRIKVVLPKGDPTCVYKSKYSTVKRKEFYPFKVADTVKLISFRYHNKNYPIANNALIKDSILEMRVLSKNGVDTLTDILYNNFYKEQPNTCSYALCFFPRNAIVFCDKTGNVIDYILICFHCGDYEKSSDKIFWGDKCDQKIRKLQNFFIANGISFGTNPDINIYPGEESGEGS